jgi:Mg-chelatase subunit ChlD
MGAANPKINRDDQPLPDYIPEPEVQGEESHSTLKSSILTHKNYYTLNPSSSTEVISSLVLESETSNSSSKKRTPVDLVLVIDVSGSMEGEKIELVKKTLDFLLTQLGPNDRVSLVTFSNSGSRLVKLTCCDEAGKKRLATLIRSLRADGGTNLVEGLEYGICVLSGRRMINQSSAIVLLTDGIDNDSYTSVERARAVIEKVPVSKEYSIHTFGYGSDHDANLLNAISDSKNGGFYFIEQLDSIAQAFANCLGEVMSIIFDSIQVSLKTEACAVRFALKQVFSENGDVSFSLPAILRGVKKEVVFVLDLPSQELPSEDLEVFPVKALISYHDVKLDQVLTQESTLSLTLKHTTTEELKTNPQVMADYYRFKTADAIKKAGNFGDRNQLEEAKHELDDCILSLQNEDIASHEIAHVLQGELEKAKSNFKNESHYQHVGKISNMKSAKSHWNKRGENLEIYQNHCQMDMIFESKNFFSKHE